LRRRCLLVLGGGLLLRYGCGLRLRSRRLLRLLLWLLRLLLLLGRRLLLRLLLSGGRLPRGLGLARSSAVVHRCRLPRCRRRGCSIGCICLGCGLRCALCLLGLRRGLGLLLGLLLSLGLLRLLGLCLWLRRRL